jgi:hypothetical protein
MIRSGIRHQPRPKPLSLQRTGRLQLRLHGEPFVCQPMTPCRRPHGLRASCHFPWRTVGQPAAALIRRETEPNGSKWRRLPKLDASCLSQEQDMTSFGCDLRQNPPRAFRGALSIVNP